VSEKIPFPAIIDATMRKAFRACPQMFYLSYVERWKPKGISPHLHFGGCFAKGLEVTRKAFYGEGLSETDAIKEGGVAIIELWGDYESPAYGSGSQKTLMNCLLAHSSYFEQYNLTDDIIKPVMKNGKPAVEFTFAIPIPNVLHPTSGDPILYAGRFDMLAEHHSGAYFVDDEKTASQLGEGWKNSFKLASQMTGYCWAAREYGYPVQGAVIRGVAILKTEFKHLMLIEQRDNWMIDRWLLQLKRDINQMIACWKEGIWDHALDEACSSYGGCRFLPICTSPNPRMWLENDFEYNSWNPLAKETD
jgi:hypothetical protein